MMVEYANSYLKKALGLMFRRPGAYHMIFNFKTSSKDPVHTFFCRMPITITFIDEYGVEETYRNIRPNQIIWPERRYIRIVETTSI